MFLCDLAIKRSVVWFTLCIGLWWLKILMDRLLTANWRYCYQMLRSFLSCTCISPPLEIFLYFGRASIFLQLIKQATLYSLQTGVVSCKVLLHGNAVVGYQDLFPLQTVWLQVAICLLVRKTIPVMRYLQVRLISFHHLLTCSILHLFLLALSTLTKHIGWSTSLSLCVLSVQVVFYVLQELSWAIWCSTLSLLISELHHFQTHQETLKKLVDLIGITSIMEVGFKS